MKRGSGWLIWFETTPAWNLRSQPGVMPPAQKFTPDSNAMTQLISGSEILPPNAADVEGKSKRGRSPRLPIALGVVAAIGAGAAVWYGMARPVESGLRVSGRIEGYETDVGAKTGGRIDAIAVREGDVVKTGQLLVSIDDAEVQAQLRGAQAQVAVAQSQAQTALWQIDVVNSQLQGSQLGVRQSQQVEQGQIYQAQSNLATAEAQLQQGLAQLKLAAVDRDRTAQLVAAGAVSREQFDQAQTAYESAQATVAANQKQVESARGALTLAQSYQYTPAIQTAQQAALLGQQQQAYAQLKTAQANVDNALAAQQRIEAQIAYLAIASPIDGVVTARTREPGAVITNGQTVLTLVDLNAVYLRAYVPEGDIGRVRVGQGAKIFLDSNPQQPLEGSIAAIDPVASFTPENIYFQQDRVKQVFGIKIAIHNPNGFAKPGMPADAEIEIESRPAG